MSFYNKYVLRTPRKDASQWTVLFLFGFMVGVLFLHFMDVDNKIQNTLVNDEILQRLGQIQLNLHKFFWYVFRERIFFLVGLTIVATTVVGGIVCKGFLVWYGVTLGMMMASLTIEYGVKGILLYILYGFPQVLCYIPIMMYFTQWCGELHRIVYRKEGVRNKQLFLVKMVILLVAVLITMLLECYLNPFFVKLLIGFF
ncbi:MAG: hypothetical protein R3Y54_01200 [Eubacteriales bacterium]